MSLSGEDIAAPSAVGIAVPMNLPLLLPKKLSGNFAFQTVSPIVQKKPVSKTNMPSGRAFCICLKTGAGIQSAEKSSFSKFAFCSAIKSIPHDFPENNGFNSEIIFAKFPEARSEEHTSE